MRTESAHMAENLNIIDNHFVLLLNDRDNHFQIQKEKKAVEVEKLKIQEN